MHLARDHGVTGIGVDMSPLFTVQANLRAEELGVADQVKFIHGDAAGFISDEKVSVAACVGASWIAGGSRRHYSAFGAKACSPGGDHSHRRALLAAVTADGRYCQGLSCQLNFRLSHASQTYLRLSASLVTMLLK